MEKSVTIYDVFKEKIGVKKRLDIKKRELAIKALISTNEDRDIMREKIILPLVIDILKATVHFNFENYKDVLNINPEETRAFLTRKRINPPSLYTYNNVQKDSLFLLVLFASLEQENISINNQNIDIIIKLLGGENITIEEISELGITNPFNLDLLKKIKRNNFEFSFLSEEECIAIENYHYEYMLKEILPLVTDFKYPNQVVLKRVEDVILRR